MSRSRLAGFLLLGSLYAGVGLAAPFSPDSGSDDPTQGEVVEATPVSGQVTVGGQPLQGATVKFQNDKGQAVSAKTGPDGSYALPARNLPVGDLKITITVEAPKPPKGNRLPKGGKHVSPK